MSITYTHMHLCRLVIRLTLRHWIPYTALTGVDGLPCLICSGNTANSCLIDDSAASAGNAGRNNTISAVVRLASANQVMESFTRLGRVDVWGRKRVWCDEGEAVEEKNRAEVHHYGWKQLILKCLAVGFRVLD